MARRITKNVAQLPEDPLRKVFNTIDLGEGQRLTPEQVALLLDIKLKNGEKLLRPERAGIALDVIDMLRRLPFDEVVAYIKESYNVEDFVFASPFLENERRRVQLEIDNIQSKIEAEEGVFRCQECGQTRTVAYHMQVRGADEPMCIGCGKKWRID
jgi:DNA-directed RNA polymerase subunit M/transcription elongation factor TFIIS